MAVPFRPTKRLKPPLHQQARHQPGRELGHAADGQELQVGAPVRSHNYAVNLPDPRVSMISAAGKPWTSTTRSSLLPRRLRLASRSPPAPALYDVHLVQVGRELHVRPVLHGDHEQQRQPSVEFYLVP